MLAYYQQEFQKRCAG